MTFICPADNFSTDYSPVVKPAQMVLRTKARAWEWRNTVYSKAYDFFQGEIIETLFCHRQNTFSDFIPEIYKVTGLFGKII